MPPKDYEEWPEFVQPDEPKSLTERLVTAHNEWGKEMIKQRQIWIQARIDLEALVHHSVFQQQQKLDKIKTQAEQDYEHCKDQRRTLLEVLGEEDGAEGSVWDEPLPQLVLGQIKSEEIDEAAVATEHEATPMFNNLVDMAIKTESSKTPETHDSEKSTRLGKRPRVR